MDHHVEVDPPPLVRLPAAPSASTMILERLVATVTHNNNISVFILVVGRRSSGAGRRCNRRELVKRTVDEVRGLPTSDMRGVLQILRRYPP